MAMTSANHGKKAMHGRRQRKHAANTTFFTAYARIRLSARSAEVKAIAAKLTCHLCSLPSKTNSVADNGAVVFTRGCPMLGYMPGFARSTLTCQAVLVTVLPSTVARSRDCGYLSGHVCHKVRHDVFMCFEDGHADRKSFPAVCSTELPGSNSCTTLRGTSNRIGTLGSRQAKPACADTSDVDRLVVSTHGCWRLA